MYTYKKGLKVDVEKEQMAFNKCDILSIFQIRIC